MQTRMWARKHLRCLENTSEGLGGGRCGRGSGGGGGKGNLCEQATQVQYVKENWKRVCGLCFVAVAAAEPEVKVRDGGTEAVCCLWEGPSVFERDSLGQAGLQKTEQAHVSVNYC